MQDLMASLSPTVYVDDLLNDLKRHSVGCHWRHQFTGAICYADNIALLAPTVDALRQMLKIYENFPPLTNSSLIQPRPS